MTTNTRSKAELSVQIDILKKEVFMLRCIALKAERMIRYMRYAQSSSGFTYVPSINVAHRFNGANVNMFQYATVNQLPISLEQIFASDILTQSLEVQI